MNPWLLVSVIWLSPMALMSKASIPRRSVPYHRDNAVFFTEEGVSNYSTMLLREDLDLLILGAREAVYALDLYNISNDHASSIIDIKRYSYNNPGHMELWTTERPNLCICKVKWEVTQQQIDLCQFKGKDPETQCKNYIRILHKTKDGKMFVCGTNAFDPKCDYMSYVDGKLLLEKKDENGRGRCPFDPFQRYASIMDGDNNLYSATSKNFLGTEFALTRTPSSISTIAYETWLKDPTFVSMAQVPESENSEQGDDDKVYLFFTETPVEWGHNNKLVVSRVARVCKGDIGGRRTLVKKWTSFLKARLGCPVPNSKLPYVVQDTYLWCDPQRSWKHCLFYAIFTSQTDTPVMSALCVYSVSEISKAFAQGKYKTLLPVLVNGTEKWITHEEDVPFPRPGACIDNDARKAGINQTLDLPDKTLLFMRKSHLMDQAIQPKGEEPVFFQQGATFTNIVINQVRDVDGDKHNVMFIGTAKGSILKAVNYDGEMFIIEEVQLFKSPEPIKILKFSNITGQLYAGSNDGVGQMPLATCERSSTCVDCVLARDPYCGWDTVAGKCAALSDAQQELTQSVKEGDASLCPAADAVKTVDQQLQLGGYLKLHCWPLSNLAKTVWEKDHQPFPSSSRHVFIQDGLLILNASHTDAGRYRCLSVEHSNVAEFTVTVAEYLISGEGLSEGPTSNPEEMIQRDSPSVVALQASVGALLVLLLGLVGWNFYKGLKCIGGGINRTPETLNQEEHSEGDHCC